MKRCIAWFKKYCSIEDPDVLAPEGMERFCRDIEVDPENIVMLGKQTHRIHSLPHTKKSRNFI